jgi:peptidoglycan/xylan/chitin deacetylase (PgdA/CDA1 family)
MNRLSLYALLPRVHKRFSGASERPLYLTFDDGPDPEVTPRVLDELDRHGARGTFFVVGERARQHPNILAEIVARGHDLGNHSFSHHRFDALPLGAQIAEVEQTDELLRQFRSTERSPFRPPHGRANVRLLVELGIRRYRTIFWSVDSKDYAHDCAASIARLSGRVKAGDVVLLHDDHATAVDVLRDRLPAWAAAGHSHPTITSAIDAA